jgi:hypothetical protein
MTQWRIILFLTAILVSTVLLNSCDPGIGVVLSNQSSTDKKVEVHYPTNFHYIIRDSLTVYNNTAPDSIKWKLHLKTPVLSKDSTKRTYTFVLKAGRDALVEKRWATSAPTYGQVFIIDNKDTVELKPKSKQFKKRPRLMLGGEWKYTIKSE